MIKISSSVFDSIDRDKYDKIYVVNSSFGNDGTAQPNDKIHAYLTVSQAISDAKTDSDNNGNRNAVLVLEGAYNESGVNQPGIDIILENKYTYLYFFNSPIISDLGSASLEGKYNIYLNGGGIHRTDGLEAIVLGRNNSSINIYGEGEISNIKVTNSLGSIGQRSRVNAYKVTFISHVEHQNETKSFYFEECVFQNGYKYPGDQHNDSLAHFNRCIFKSRSLSDYNANWQSYPVSDKSGSTLFSVTTNPSGASVAPLDVSVLTHQQVIDSTDQSRHYCFGFFQNFAIGTPDFGTNVSVILNQCQFEIGADKHVGVKILQDQNNQGTSIKIINPKVLDLSGGTTTAYALFDQNNQDPTNFIEVILYGDQYDTDNRIASSSVHGLLSHKNFDSLSPDDFWPLSGNFSTTGNQTINLGGDFTIDGTSVGSAISINTVMSDLILNGGVFGLAQVYIVGSSGNIDVSAEADVNIFAGLGSNNFSVQPNLSNFQGDSPVLTDRTTFSNNDEFVTKSYVDTEISSNISSSLIGLGKRDFNDTLTSPPADQQVRLNNSTVSSATELYIDDNDKDTLDRSPIISKVTSGSIIRLIKDSSNFHVFEVTSNTDNTGSFTLGITWIESKGTIINGAEVSVSVDVVGDQVDISGKADKDDTIPDGEVLKKKSGGNYEGAGYGADQVVQLNDVDVTDISEGESKILTVLKEVGTGNPVFEGAVQQLDKIVSSSFDSLLADTADWIGDILTLTGDNSDGQLGQNGQEHQMNGQFYLCISHILDVTGSAIWVRNRSRDALDPSLSSDQNVITELEEPTGWDSEDTKIISVRSKVGSWYSDVSGYVYFCFDESGSNWYWRRVGVPTAEFIQISDQALKDEIEAHDFGATPILKPVATENGKDRQEHYWETGVSQTGEVLASGDGSTVQFTGNLANLEVNPGTVSITDGTEIFSDNVDGTLTGDAGGSGTIDYVTGAYDVTFNTAPVSGTDNITADYESEPFTPHLAKCIDDGGTKKWIKQI